MQHTTNYNLSQYDATDHVTRDAFNADNLVIDAALKANADAAAGALAAAQAAAAAGCRIVTGTYTGTGSQSVSINVGFYPKAVILSEKDSVHIQALVTRDQEPWTGGSVVTVTLLRLTDTGFEVACAYNAMYTNSSGKYYYIAIG